MTFSSRLTHFLFLLTLLPFFLTAQTLQRKGTFGIQMEATEDKSGIAVIKVFDNTTASALELQEADILLTVNGEAYTDVYDLVDAVGTWRVDDPLSLTIKRGKKTRKLTGKVVGKPLETSTNGEVQYGEVDFDGGKLRSILILPEGVENPAVVQFLPGIGCGSLDYFYNPTATTKLLVESIVAEGIAVYRVEKPGMGDSEGTSKSCHEMDYDYEVAAMTAGLQTLKQHAGIDSNQVFLYGHSLGVITAPVIASQHKVAGIIAWGGISTSWFEYSLTILRDQKVLMGMDYADMESNFREVLPFYYDFLVNKMTPQELAENPAYEELVASHFQGDLWHGLHHYSFFHTLNEVDLLTAYKEADCPVLALAGAHDLHTVSTDWAEKVAAAVNHYRPQQGASVILPQTTHHYHTTPTIEQYLTLRSTGKLTDAYMAQHFNHDIGMIVGRWVEQQVDRADKNKLVQIENRKE